MKSKTNTIILTLILVVLAVIAYQLIANRMEHRDNIRSAQDAEENANDENEPEPKPVPTSGQTKIQIAATKLRTQYGNWPVEQCSYQGKQVLKVDTRPVDGPVMVFNDDAVKIGEASSGFGGNQQSTIDFNQVTNCRAI
jgi:hypothetical protein